MMMMIDHDYVALTLQIEGVFGIPHYRIIQLVLCVVSIYVPVFHRSKWQFFVFIKIWCN